MPCGFGPGQDKARCHGVCPAATEEKLNGLNGGINGGRACWMVSGTNCANRLAGNLHLIASACQTCHFFQLVSNEEENQFQVGSTILESWQHHRKGSERIRTRILTPLIVVFSLIIALATGGFLHNEYNELHKQAHTNLEMGKLHFAQEVSAEAEKLLFRLHVITQNEEIYTAWKEHDGQRLKDISNKLLHELGGPDQSGNLCLFEPNLSCSFALWKGQREEENEEVRVTLLQAAKHQIPAFGLESGNGSLQLIVIHPWLIDNNLIGYLKLEENVSNLLPHINNTIGVKILFALKKSCIRPNALASIQQDEKTKNRNLCDDFIIISDTPIADLDALSKELHLENNALGHNRADHSHTPVTHRFTLNDKMYHGAVAPIINTAGTNIGDMVVLTEVGASLASIAILASTFLIISIAAGGGLTAVFYIYLGKIQTQIVTANDLILREVADRRVAEEGERRAREQAERANQAKSDFLAHMSHEIRTPMTGAIGMIDLTLETDLDVRQKEYLSMAKNATRNLLHQINDILDISKIEANKIVLNNEEFRLNELIQSVIDTLTFQAKEKGVTLKATIDSETVPKTLFGDPDRLHQIILNLTANALKFTKIGEIIISCSGKENQSGSNAITAEKKEKVPLHITVKDTGIGIPADKLLTIFAPFSQADSSTTKRYGGTGLGLTISQGLASLMDGELWAESEPGKGSTFHVTVALYLSAQPRPGMNNREIPTDEAPVDLNGLKALVVEDEETIMAMIVHQLETSGCQVMSAENGKIALNLLDSAHFDFVIMDMRMPVMNGMETCRAIRLQEETTAKHLPIIAVTADVLNQARNRCLDAGADNYLAKPFEPSALLAVIKKTLVRQRKKSTAPAAGAIHDRPTPGTSSSEHLISEDFNYQAALLKAEGDPLKAKSVITAFPAEALLLIEQLKAALNTDTATDIKKPIAILKHIARHAGATRCADLALKLELHMDGGKRDKTLADLDKIQAALLTFKESADLSDDKIFEID